jgi:acyl-CoA synthetase (AMP-forming)/AMP-acid ligase II
VYTSGTTGRPKGVLFDHATVMQHATITCLEYEIAATSRYLVQIPHNSSVNITIVPCLTVGAAVGFEDSRGFDPNHFADAIASVGATHTFLVPTQLVRILDQLPVDEKRLSTLTTLGYGSSPISPDRLGELIDRFGPIFIQLYGMAEIASIGTLLRKNDHVLALSDSPQLLRSCGRPSMGIDVRVVREDGSPVDIGERGEVIFAGHHVMTSYYRDGLTGLPEMGVVAEQLWRQSQLAPEDVDVAVLYDHFTPFVLIQLEELGFCPRGEARNFLADGALELGGRLPLNPHGGQLGEAYIHGMNGIAEGVRQVRGTSVNQVDGVEHVLVTAGTGVPTSALVLRPDR